MLKEEYPRRQLAVERIKARHTPSLIIPFVRSWNTAALTVLRGIEMEEEPELDPNDFELGFALHSQRLRVGALRNREYFQRETEGFPERWYRPLDIRDNLDSSEGYMATSFVHLAAKRSRRVYTGHADFAAQSQLELDLVTFIMQHEGRICNVSWEDVLSGYGIQRIHRFFKQRSGGGKGGDNGPHPDEIFNARNRDEDCRKTFELYTTFYARCAKNLALDALALGGVYIAGGIAAKNLPMFELPAFMNEFVNCGKQQKLLAQVPIWVITDYNVSLYGAAAYMLLEGVCDLF